MKHALLILGALGLVAALALKLHAEPPSAARSADALLAAAKQLETRFLAAFNHGTDEELAALYWNHADLTMYPPDAMELRGWEAVKASLCAMTSADPRPQLEIIDPHYRVAGDVVITWGKWKMTMAGPDGEPMEVIGRSTDVRAERDGKWVFILDHVSVPMAAQGEE